VGGNPEKFVCKSKKSPTKLFAGMKKIVCRKMTPEKNVFTDDTEKKLFVSEKFSSPSFQKNNGPPHRYSVF